jgi:hypothetical protein
MTWDSCALASLEEAITTVAHSLRRIQTQQHRVRVLLDAAPQPRQVARNEGGL